MSFNQEGKLNECINKANCFFVEWDFENINKSFELLIGISSKLPRTTVIEKNESYWHGVCRSLIFRFPDDLEILKLPKDGLIQIKSSSRIGASDLGVNKNRINYLYRQLIKKSNDNKN